VTTTWGRSSAITSAILAATSPTGWLMKDVARPFCAHPAMPESA